MHSDAVCAGIGRSVACEKGQNSRSLLPKSATLVAVDCDDHALANGLAIVVGSIVGKISYSYRSSAVFRSLQYSIKI